MGTREQWKLQSRGFPISIRKYAWPVFLSLAVALLAGRTSSLVDSGEGPAPLGVSLNLPTSYIATSPVSRVLDALTLLSNPQTAALFITIAAIVLPLLIRTRSRSRRRPWVRGLLGSGYLLLVLVALEAAVIFAPRPMAYIGVTDTNVVRVDFHSHTRASRDANQRFTAEDRRSWHRDGGFDVGYITDHVRFGGAVEAAHNNPVRAGDGVSELSAVEGRYHKILSTIMLGLTQADTAVLDGKGHLLPGTPSSGRGPVTIVALPNGNIDSVTVESVDSLPHFAGMELVDAAPRGLGQLDREEAKVRRIAHAAGLILVAASNNHGYGRTVAAWNLMSIPGWRELSPDSVGRLIEQPFRDRQTGAVVIVKRLRPRTHGAQLIFTLPVLSWQILGALTLAERAVWLGWIWGITAITMALRSRRHS